MQQPKDSLFRRTALERLSSPEELDQLIQVTTPAGWLSLAALVLLLIAGVVWARFGTIRGTAAADGILLRGDRIETVQVPIAGQVTNIYITPDEVVERGQRIANIYDPGSNQFTFVRSPAAGRVVELRISEGNTVGAGTPLMTVEPAEGVVQALLYLPPNIGQKILEGQVVMMEVPPAAPEQYGYLVGVVKSVSDFPISPQTMLSTLASQALVERLSGDTAPIEVRVSLFPDERFQPSGFVWTRPGGPPFELRGGILTSAIIITDEFHPIELVLNTTREEPRDG